MTIDLELRGRDVTRKQLNQICEVLGYTAADVSSIRINGRGPLVVELFVRVPWPDAPKGIKPLAANGPGYSKARVTHDIVRAPAASAPESDKSAMSDERLAALADLADRGPLARVEVQELLDEIHRVKESR